MLKLKGEVCAVSTYQLVRLGNTYFILSLQCFGQRGGSGGSSEAAAGILPRPGEVPQLADGGRDDLQRLNRRHQQGEDAGAAGGS